jgi:hypothetical protein
MCTGTHIKDPRSLLRVDLTKCSLSDEKCSKWDGITVEFQQNKEQQTNPLILHVIVKGSEAFIPTIYNLFN